MDKAFVEECKQKLESQKLELEKGIQNAKSYLAEGRENFAEEEERAEVDEDRAEKESKLDNLIQEKEHVEHTIKKADDGKFGICEKCGLPIDTARLEIMPTACLCMKCKMICDSCGVEIEAARISGKPIPLICQKCEEEFESETTYTSSTINPHN